MSPESATLLLQSQTHAGVAVGLPASTRSAIHQIEVSRARLCLPIAVLWEVTRPGGGATQLARTLQLDGHEGRTLEEDRTLEGFRK